MTGNIKNMYDKCVTFIKNDSILIDAVVLFIVRVLYSFITFKLLNHTSYFPNVSYGVNLKSYLSLTIKDIIPLITYTAVMLFMLTRKYNVYFIKIFVSILFCLYYLPVNASYSLNQVTYVYMILTTIYTVLIIHLLSVDWKDIRAFLHLKNKFANNSRENTCCENTIVNKKKWLSIFFGALCITYIIFKIYYNGFTFNISISHDIVYSVRAQYATFLDNISGTLFAYVISLLVNLISFITPIYLLYSLVNHSVIGVIISVVTILSQYSIEAGKGMLFMVPIIVFIFILNKLNLLDFGSRLIYVGMLILIVISFCVVLIKGSSFIYTYIIRREMYLPARLNEVYYEFFSSNKKIHWSQNTFILQNIFSDVYAEGPLDIINRLYFNGNVVSPNTGMFAEAYMHFGIIGVMMYPILLNLLAQGCALTYTKIGKCISMFVAVKLTILLTNVPMVRTDFVLSAILSTVLIYFVCYVSQKKRGNYNKK